MANKIIASKIMTDAQADAMHKQFLSPEHCRTLITEDTDVYELNTNKLLARFRKNAISLDVLKLGVDSFRDSIERTEGRGAASGHSGKRIRKDGSISNTTVGNFVESGNVGYMDSSAMVRYCRKTAFAKKYFDKFTQGIPFVQAIDKLYAELAPVHYARQMNISKATNVNYRIADTSFTTVTVNKNFQTAVHKDSGDLPDGFGNLIAYREGNWGGCYFTLLQYGLGFDLQNTDVLFVDVHQWHANTPFTNFNPEAGDLRISFVLYYREYMYMCKTPSEELARVKQDQNGFLKL